MLDSVVREMLMALLSWLNASMAVGGVCLACAMTGALAGYSGLGAAVEHMIRDADWTIRQQ